MNRTLSAVAVAIALGLTISACGGSTAATASNAAASPHSSLAGPVQSSSPAPAGSPATASPANAGGSACDLVTADEVTKAIGKPTKLTGGAGNSCTFSEVADPTLSVDVKTYPDEASLAGPKILMSAGGEHLAGIGDNAFWVAVSGTILVQKGSRGFSFSIPSLAALTSNPDALKANMVALAQAALTRF